MHQYPLWKSMTVLAVVLVSIVLALPNVFGETAALQLSRKDRAAFAEASVQELEQLLERERIAYEDAYLDADGRLWIRFGDVERQIEARDLIAREYEGQFAIATTFAPRAPRWLTGLGLKPMSLGLDLRGGIYLVYEVDVEGAVAQLTQVLERDLRKVLRDARIPYDEVAAAGPAVRLIIKDPAQTSGAVDAVRKFDPQLAVRLGDLPGQVVVELTPDQIRQRQDFAIQQNITALNNRVNALGVAEPVIQRQGLNRIAVQLPGIQDAAEVVRVLGKVATLEFRLVDQANARSSPQVSSSSMRPRRSPRASRPWTSSSTGEAARRCCAPPARTWASPWPWCSSRGSGSSSSVMAARS